MNATSQVFLPSPFSSEMMPSNIALPNNIKSAKITAKKKPSKKQTKHALSSRPRRALTAYNLFTTFMRQKIVQGTHLDGVAATPEDVYKISMQHKNKTKRVHRKTEGMVSFQTLSRMIAEAWKVLPQDQKDVFEAQALLEKRERQAKMLTFQVVSPPEGDQTPGAPMKLATLLGMKQSIEEEIARCSSPQSDDSRFVTESDEETMTSEEDKFDEEFFAALVEDLVDDGGEADALPSMASPDFPSSSSTREYDFWDAFTSTAAEENDSEIPADLSIDDFEMEALL